MGHCRALLTLCCETLSLSSLKVLLAMGDRQFYFLLPKLPPQARVRARCDSHSSTWQDLLFHCCIHKRLCLSDRQGHSSTCI